MYGADPSQADTPRIRRAWPWLVLLAVLVGVLVLFRWPGAVPLTRLPVFSVPDLLAPDSTLSTADLAGRPVLLNVWATWCVPCRQEHDQLLRVAATREVEMVGINWRDRRADALRWLERLGNPYTRIGEDADGDLGAALGVTGAPETLLVDAAGVVLYRHVGPLTEDVWRDELRSLLPEAR